MNILILSAYEAVSHRYWREGLIKHFPEHQWTSLTLAPRYFQWRIRGNPLSWLGQQGEQLKKPYDLVVATSMVDLATLRGLVPRLAVTPSLLYMHENQFAYPSHSPSVSPRSKQEQAIQQTAMQMVNLYSMLAADCIAFNSQWNLQSCFDGIDALSRRLPERIDPSLCQELAQKSCVLPVPIDSAAIHEVMGKKDQESKNFAEQARLQVVWNHRWEYDKGPDQLLAFVLAVKRAALPVDLHIVGQRFRSMPSAMEKLEKLIKTLSVDDALQCKQWGPIAKHVDYLTLLRHCDVVLSTALHDFQGLSVLEAVAMGCIPLLPKRLAYPEYFSDDYLYQGSDDLVQEAASACGRLGQWQRSGLPAVPALSDLAWSNLRDRYCSLFESLTS